MALCSMCRMTTTQSTHELLTEPEAAARLRMLPATLRRWRWAGRGPAYIRVSGRAIRYAVSDIEAFVTAARRTSTSDPGPANAGNVA